MAEAAFSERSVVALLELALAPVPVHWGFAPFESVEAVPVLPIVVVQRLSYSTAAYEDMCEASAYVGDTLLALHVWALGYEQARSLTDQVRAAMSDARGWRLQQEVDQYESAFRAWCIAGQWLAAGVPPA
jgi:hypothetical protein